MELHVFIYVRTYYGYFECKNIFYYLRGLHNIILYYMKLFFNSII